MTMRAGGEAPHSSSRRGPGCDGPAPCSIAPTPSHWRYVSAQLMIAAFPLFCITLVRSIDCSTVNLSQSDTSEGLKRAIEGRIQALANVHSLFVDSRWIGAELSAVATQELAPYSEKSKTRVRIEGPQVLLEPNAAQSIAVILHELATNAAKHGALSTANGQVDLKWSHEADRRLHLHWTETGGPAVQEPTRKGFGRRVTEQMIAQLKGKTRFSWRAEGLVCEIILQV